MVYPLLKKPMLNPLVLRTTAQFFTCHSSARVLRGWCQYSSRSTCIRLLSCTHFSRSSHVMEMVLVALTDDLKAAGWGCVDAADASRCDTSVRHGKPWIVDSPPQWCRDMGVCPTVALLFLWSGIESGTWSGGAVSVAAAWMQCTAGDYFSLMLLNIRLRCLVLMLFNIYMHCLAQIAQKYGLGCHQYADDTRLYLLMDGWPDSTPDDLDSVLQAE